MMIRDSGLLFFGGGHPVHMQHDSLWMLRLLRVWRIATQYVRHNFYSLICVS